LKNNRIAKLTALFLAVLTIAALFAACADTTKPETTTDIAATTPAPEEETTASIYDENGYLLDKLPAKMNIGGEIAILYWEDVENVEFNVTETNGNLVDDAIYKRDANVQDRLNVTFVYSCTPGNNNNNAAFTNYVQNSINNGDTIDIIASYSMTTANICTLGLAENLLEYKTLDFDSPWWPQDLVNEATINDKLFFCSGDISTNLLYMMYTVFFNKDIVTNYKLDNPYTLVANNEWTFEKFFEMAKSVSDSGTVGTDDYIYGFNITSAIHADPFFYGAGLRTISRGEDGTPVISETWHNELAENVVHATNSFLNSPCSTITTPDRFLTNTSLFTMNRAVYAQKNLSNTDINYGIAVTPKYTSDQENYATALAFPATLYAISTSSQRKEESATVLEALCSEGYRTVTPMLYEVSMKSKYSKDSESGQMFDIIRETVVFDLGRLYTTAFNKRTYQLFRGVMTASTYVSYTTSFKVEAKQMQTYLEKLLKCFE